jgi:AAA domain
MNTRTDADRLVTSVVSPIDNGRRTTWTARELLATEFPEPRYAVPALIPEGLSFLAGAPKLGKSWLMLNVGLGVASGGRVLGQLQVDQGEVLYLALEDPPRRLKGRLGLLLGSQDAPEGLHFETEWPRLSEGGAEQIGVWLSNHPDTRLVVIDVFSRIRPRLLDDRADRFMTDYSAGELLKSIADANRVAMTALHHTRKAAAEDFVDMISGTHGLAASADTIMVAKRGRGQADATLQVTGRDVEEQDLALQFDSTLGTWSLLGDAREWAVHESRRKILKAVKDATKALGPKEIAEESGVDYDVVKHLVRRMEADDQLSGDGKGAYLPFTPFTRSLDEVIDGE